MAAPLLRGLPSLLRLRSLQHDRGTALLFSPASSRLFCTAASETFKPDDTVSSSTVQGLSFKEPPSHPKLADADFLEWKDKEAEILQDIEPITSLTKDILHSDRYMDGQRLADEDEAAVVEKLLAHHPHSGDKIGCGLDCIMVDRHPQFRRSRCLFVVRTDGRWIDFSYQKCLRAYIRKKYPSLADKFIRQHFKRGSG